MKRENKLFSYFLRILFYCLLFSFIIIIVIHILPFNLMKKLLLFVASVFLLVILLGVFIYIIQLRWDLPAVFVSNIFGKISKVFFYIFYRYRFQNSYVVLFIHGLLEVQELKLKKLNMKLNIINHYLHYLHVNLNLD